MPAELDRRSRARLTRALWLARAAMLWERGAGVWAPLVLACLAIATAGLWGLFEQMPALASDLIVAAALLIALGFAVAAALKLRWPSREEARERVETDSRLVHAPLSALDDRPVSGDAALWDLHRAKAAETLGATRIGPPKAGFAAADPFALRYALLVAAALALWARGPSEAPKAFHGFRPVAKAAQAVGLAGGRLVGMVQGALGVVHDGDAKRQQE